MNTYKNRSIWSTLGIVIAGLAVALFFGYAVVSAVMLPTVSQSHSTKEIVGIEDAHGRPVPKTNWDKVLAGRYEHYWVP